MSTSFLCHAFGLPDHPYPFGSMEGTNNKIKTLKSQAFGYRDQEFFGSVIEL